LTDQTTTRKQKQHTRVLMTSPEDWGEIRVSKHHYAAAAAEEGMHVYFLNPPSSAHKSLSIQTTDHDHIRIINQPPLQAGLRFLPNAFRRRYEIKRLVAIEALIGHQVNIIWNFDPYQFRFLARADRQERNHIFHLVDYPYYPDIAAQAENADLCIGVIEGHVELLRTAGSKHVLCVGHAFAPRPTIQVQHPALNTKRIKFAYIGNLSRTIIDLEALERIATRRPEIDLFLIGPHGSSNLERNSSANLSTFERLTAIPNVHWTGPVGWQDISGWMDKMDVLLIAHRTKTLAKHSASPHKLLEYFSSGKEILSNYIEDMEPQFEGLLNMTDRGEPVDAGLDEIMNKLDQGADLAIQERRKKIAHDRSYQASLRAILKQLGI